MIEHDGYRVGLVGLIEEDWLAACATVDVGNLQCARPMTPPARLYIPISRPSAAATQHASTADSPPRRAIVLLRTSEEEVFVERQHSLPHASS